MYCPKCAAPVSDGALVCPQCHTALSIAAPAVAPVSPVAAAQFAAAAPALAPIRAYTGPAQPSSKATASLALGIIGLVLSIILIGIPLGVIAVIFGHLALSEIKKSGGRLEGRGKAIAGLVTGYICVAMVVMLPFIMIIAAIAIPNLLKAKMAANESSAASSLRVYNTAIVSYESSCRRPPLVLSDLGPVPGGGSPSCDTGMGLVDADLGSGQKSGYNFAYESIDAEHYTVNADPINAGSTGVKHFFTDESGTVRYNAGAPADASSPPL